MLCTLSFVFCFELECSFDMYKFIYQLSSFQFNSDLMPWCEETGGNFKHQVINIILALVRLIIPHGGGLPVAQLFSYKMVVSPLGITFVFTRLVFFVAYSKAFPIDVPILVYARCV